MAKVHGALYRLTIDLSLYPSRKWGPPPYSLRDLGCATTQITQRSFPLDPSQRDKVLAHMLILACGDHHQTSHQLLHIGV